MKLNLGAGNRQIDGWLSVDHYALADMDVDLFRFPWPWEDSSVEAVAMFHILEHFDPDDVVKAIKEVHRILSPNGLFWLKVPHAQGMSAHGLGHKTYFSSATMRVLWTDEFPYLGIPAPLFRTELFRLKLINFRDRLEWTPFDWLVSRFPAVYEKIGLFPPAEIEWKGRKLSA
jgi:SAM-dependent methyltransferase